MLPQSLPGIRRIYYTYCYSLPPRVMLTGLCGGAVVLFRDGLVPVPFAGEPVLKWDGSMENGSRVEKSTLTFRTSHALPEGVRIAFVVETFSGKSCLIGAREPNYPVVEYSETTGETAGEAAVRTYNISHIAVKSVIPVLL